MSPVAAARHKREQHDNDFPPFVLREYAAIADGERGALIGPKGDICWMCAPSWDADGVFSALIGGRGRYAVTPADGSFVWGGFYEPATLIWHSRWVTTSRTIEVREALAFPGDRHRTVILRRLLAIDGQTRVRAVLDPRAGFGQHRMRDLTLTDGVWTARTGKLFVRWSGAGRAQRQHDGSLAATLTVEAGGYCDLVLEISDQRLPHEAVDPARAWEQTEAGWADAVPELTGTLADTDARHSYAVLRGLTSSSGGMVAGATTSLPERAEQGRNYDYRYAWIRDQTYAGQAVAACGGFALLDDSVRFVTERLMSDGPQLKPAYTADGGSVPDETTLKLKGYPGGSDTVGNHVNQQFQLDAFGEVLLLFAAAATRDRLDAAHWLAVETAVTAIESRGSEPDAGIWELDDQQWTHSKLTCVAGLRAISAHAPSREAARWSTLADRMLADVSETSVHPSGRWQRTPEDPRIDSALLIPGLRGAIPSHDPRTRATLRAALDELTEEGFMYRFRQDERALGDSEGAFLLCGFVTSLSLHQQGDLVEAHRWFERMRAACGTPRLFAEEYDVAQRQMRGNLPQAFVHALFLESAQRLAGAPVG